VVTCGWKFRSTKAVAGGLRPSLAGVAVTRGPKRRQESCGVRKVSFERVMVVGAEPIVNGEGSMNVVAMRDGAAPPESGTASRTKGHHRNPGDPVGSVGLVTGGGNVRGQTEARRRAETGSRIGPYYR